MQKLIYLAIILAFPFISMGQIFDPSDASICKGGNTAFKSGSIYPAPTYQWQMRHKGAWNDITTTAPFSGVTSTTLTLTSVSDTLSGDSFKCKVYFMSSLVGTSKAAQLTVGGSSTKPSSASASVNPVDCPGGSTQLSVNGGSLSGGSTWKWYAGTCGKNAVSSLVKPNATTTYYVRAEGACGDTTACVSITVTVTNTTSTAPGSITASPATICSGQSSTLAVVGGSLGSGAIWKWYSGSTCSVLIDSQGVSSLNVSPTSTSNFSVKADGKCGSTVCKNVIVRVNQLPVMNAGNDTALCLGSSITLNAYATGSNIYLWSPSSGLNDATILNPDASPATTTTYILKVTDPNNCTKSDTVNVKVNLLPKVKAGNDTTICKGSSAQLHSSGGVSYIWYPANGLNFANISNPISKAVVTTKYRVKVTDKNLCSDSAKVQVIVNPAPKINANNDTAICQGNSVLLHSEGGTIYNWSPATGLDFANISGPKATPNSSITYKVKVTNSFGCFETDSVIITVNPLPIANAGSDIIICNGEKPQLSTNAGAGYSYSWKPSSSLFSANTATPTAHPDITTTYQVDVSLKGCISRDSVKVTVLNGPAPVFIRFDSIVCNNSSWAQYCIPQSSHLFKWSVTNGTIMSGQGTSCLYVHWSQTASSGIVTVQDSLKSKPSCPVDVSHSVKISGGPAPSPAAVKAKGNNISFGILVSKVISYKFYEWGFESKASRSEQKSCPGDTMCLFTGGIDTASFYYWVKVGDDKACLTKSFFNQPKGVNGIRPNESAVQIALYPNPTTDKLNIESNSPLESIAISNLLGQTIHIAQSKEKNNQWSLDMSGLSRGIYFISFKTEAGIVIRKVMKQ